MNEYNTQPREKRPDALDPFARRVPYAMAYVRMQESERPLCAQDALKNGTAFQSLVKPFRVREVAR